MTARLHPPPARTPFAFVHCIMTAYALRGMDPSGALEKAQIAPDARGQWPARVSALPFERMSAHAMRELDDEALGWFSRRLPWGSYGMLARASLTAPHLGLALARWCRHHRLLTDDIAWVLERSGDTATLRLIEQRPPGANVPDAAQGAQMREFAHVSLLRNALGLSAWFIDSRIGLREAAFAYPAPPHADAYAVLFPRARVRFDAAQTAVTFDAAYLDQPLRRDEAALRTMLQRAVALMVHPDRRDRLLVERARTWLRTHPDTASAERLADALHVSVRTLQRQLHDAGTSVQGLKDQVRRDLAAEHLLRTRWPVKRIAAQVGFDNEKSFVRAFKAWTGQTPTAFRRGAGGGRNETDGVSGDGERPANRLA
ncbi:putative HTH-type transcriptional regulator [Tepidimonas fonticaldi]|uniref:Putative HTH-type transcriptional regulator n=1 Tax=Tepidimonas fonticaldi TaxID=1101373 RepID=A0A554XMY4_9BURK|nr:AraC family transcriptional regulator [Tepidimonas fonticaldi]TSE37188.1 putative HTH-type transcriptional regulator [Tepidimonas fonticaldi]